MVKDHQIVKTKMLPPLHTLLFLVRIFYVYNIVHTMMFVTLVVEGLYGIGHGKGTLG